MDLLDFSFEYAATIKLYALSTFDDFAGNFDFSCLSANCRSLQKCKRSDMGRSLITGDFLQK